MRKIKEAFLAVRIELMLSKDDILELYLNKIYLGYRAYGVGAAAQVYFGKNVNQLSLSEMATIAGLPKAPSTFNPLYSNRRAVARRNVVLTRMLEEHYITQAQYDQARAEHLVARYHAPEISFSAPYLSEMVRQEMITRYGDSAYTDGYKVYTTITKRLQLAAQQAVRNNLLAYDMRHGYRGPSKVLWRVGATAWDQNQIVDTLKKPAPLRLAGASGDHRRQRSGSYSNVGRRQQYCFAAGHHALGSPLQVRYPTRANAKTRHRCGAGRPAGVGAQGQPCLVAVAGTGCQLGAGVD